MRFVLSSASQYERAGVDGEQLVIALSHQAEAFETGAGMYSVCLSYHGGRAPSQFGPARMRDEIVPLSVISHKFDVQLIKESQ